MPLYPVAIHLLGVSAIVWLQILLSTWTVYLVYLVALAIWNHRNAALVAAGACARNNWVAKKVTPTMGSFIFVRDFSRACSCRRPAKSKNRANQRQACIFLLRLPRQPL